MASNFFNNQAHTLFDKFKGISSGMGKNFYRFLAVVGFFRSSGYFSLRKELEGVEDLRILVGINIDSIWKNHDKSKIFTGDKDKAKSIYNDDFIDDIKTSHYSKEVEEGILQMIDDLKSGKLKMRIHPSKKLHAKFYLCLPENHNEHSDGWVIMGSSNISKSGLGLTEPPTYELNISLKDFDDVNYCKEEFEKLWEEGEDFTGDDIKINETYLGYQPTPFELYMKALIDVFGDQAEDDFFMNLPSGVMDLKYQKDAVIEGYQMIMKHNGVILADVVGLGKTLIATMIAKRFVEANGKNTRILVVYPPALKKNWEDTFALFDINKKADFVSNGSLDYVLEEKNRYRSKGEYDMVIVDEAHGFRNDGTGKYDSLQKICKAPRQNKGLIKDSRKKILLLSATPLNNRPEDLLNQLLLFQNAAQCTIEGIDNLKVEFAKHIKKYKNLMAERKTGKREVTKDVDEMYEEIRKKIIDKVTIRRTRFNILHCPEYKNDLDRQGIKFPIIQEPNSLEYIMDDDTSERFYITMHELTNRLYYARYRAIEFLIPEHKKKFKSADHIAKSLANITKIHMVKRLESSFYAFKISLSNILRFTENMEKMFEENKVLIMPDLNVNDKLEKGMTLDEIIEEAMDKGYDENSSVFRVEDFEPEFKDMLDSDLKLLKELNENWKAEKDDQKFDRFRECFENELFDSEINPTGKLVLFSESKDTLDYLYDKITNELGRTDVLNVSSGNRDSLAKVIRRNFDANLPVSEQENKYNIIITTDVLAEGVNLHRSNVIVNYDEPWNSTKLMQRIGRVNRIGSVADVIVNYMFYPSRPGNKIAGLYQNALIKLQGFHSAFGEDGQIFSREEIVKEFEIFNADISDEIDKKIELLREVRNFRKKNKKWFEKIKSIPARSRVARSSEFGNSGETLVYASTNVKSEFIYVDTSGKAKCVDFLDAVQIMKADDLEKSLDISLASNHYNHVNKAIDTFKKKSFKTKVESDLALLTGMDKVAQQAINLVKQFARENKINNSERDELIKSLKNGEYQHLQRELVGLGKRIHSLTQSEIKDKIDELINDYITPDYGDGVKEIEETEPCVLLSESFV